MSRMELVIIAAIIFYLFTYITSKFSMKYIIKAVTEPPRFRGTWPRSPKDDFELDNSQIKYNKIKYFLKKRAFEILISMLWPLFAALLLLIFIDP